MVINALKQYYGSLGKAETHFFAAKNEEEHIASWQTRIRNQGTQCEYENFADTLMRDQFLAGLTSKPLPLKLIGKGKVTGIKTQHSQSTLYEKSLQSLKPWTFFINWFAQLMKNVRDVQQEQVNFTKKTTPENRSSADTLNSGFVSGVAVTIPVLVNNIV